MALCAACGHPSPPPVANRAVGDSGDHAYVADSSGLVEVSPSGTSEVVASGSIGWCAADARSRVVWFVTDHGLAAFDLDDRRIHPVIAANLAVRDADNNQYGELAVILDWGKEKLGGEDRLAFDVGVSIAMTARPRLTMAMGCDGDRAVYCFDEHARPTPAILALQAHAKRLVLADRGYVARLAERGAQRSLWSPPTTRAPAPPSPEVDRARCSEDPEQCGELTAVPAQSLWLVVTDNSRGDYFHQSRSLWDPATGEFLRVVDGKLERAPEVPADASTDYGGLRVSPAGMSIDGVVFDATHVIYRPRDEGITCGWASGGWRIPGPTG